MDLTMTKSAGRSLARMLTSIVSPAPVRVVALPAETQDDQARAAMAELRALDAAWEGGRAEPRDIRWLG